MANRRIPDNYVTVKDRVAKLRAEHGNSAAIKTETVAHCTDYFIIRVIIEVDGKVVSSGQSLYLPSEDDDGKEFSKVETAALGRALEFMGYIALDEDADEAPAKQEAPRSGGLLAARKPAPAAPPAAEAKPAAPKPAGLGGLGKKPAPAPVEVVKEDEVPDLGLDEEPRLPDDEEDEEPAPPPAPTQEKKKMSAAELMAKYKTK